MSTPSMSSVRGSSTASSFTAERPMGFGLSGARVAKTPWDGMGLEAQDHNRQAFSRHHCPSPHLAFSSPSPVLHHLVS